MNALAERSDAAASATESSSKSMIPERLTPREAECVEAYRRTRSYKATAAELGITAGHARRLGMKAIAKLGVRNIGEAVA